MSLDQAVFNTGSTTTYSVAFTATVTNQKAWVLNDEVAWDLGRNTYRLTAWTYPDAPSLAVGREAGNLGRLTISNGTLNSVFAGIGILPGSKGEMTVDTCATWNESQQITAGYGGSGSFTVRNGALAQTQYVYLGRLAGSSGTAVIEGGGSQLVGFGYFIG